MPIVPLRPKNHTVTKILPSNNLTPIRSLVVSQAVTKGLLASILYGRSTGDDTLTPYSYLTRQVMLQRKPNAPHTRSHSSTNP